MKAPRLELQNPPYTPNTFGWTDRLTGSECPPTNTLNMYGGLWTAKTGPGTLGLGVGEASINRTTLFPWRSEVKVIKDNHTFIHAYFSNYIHNKSISNKILDFLCAKNNYINYNLKNTLIKAGCILRNKMNINKNNAFVLYSLEIYAGNSKLFYECNLKINKC